jgi:two-component system LytT family response regulator
MLKVLVADDEPLARDTLKLLLNKIPYVSEIFEAKNGTETLAVAHEKMPDIVILDVEMPGQSGLELAKHLPEKCVVLFATAYNNYAVEAFELSAVDYILKPFEDERFLQAFERAAERYHHRGIQQFPKLHDAFTKITAEPQPEYRKRLVIRDPGRIRLVDVELINYIRGAGNYAEIHLNDDKTILHRETLCELEKQLDPSVFVRIHRSTIVCRTLITELRPNDKGDYTVFLANGETLTLSRRNRVKLDELVT